MAGESKAKVIPLHSNSGRAVGAAACRCSAAESSRRHPSAALRSAAAALRPSRSPPSSARSTSAAAPPRAPRPPRTRRNELAKRIAAVAEFIRKRMTGDYTVDEFGFDPHLNDAIFLPLLRVFFNSWFRVEVSGIENLPETGAALVVANHAGVLPFDGLMTVGGRARQAPDASRPAPAGRRHGVRHADDRPGRAQGRPHHGLHGRRAPAAGRRRADRGVPRGLQGPGQALQGPLQAAAVRPRRLRRRPRCGPRRRSCRARSSAPRRSTR